MRRYDAYASALAVLARAPEQDLGNEFVLSGIVDKFSLQFELGWKLLKDLLRHEGVVSAATGSPREILKSSSRYFAFLDEDAWLAMLRDRNVIAHVYDAGEMRGLVGRIIDTYIGTFMKLKQSVWDRYGAELESIPKTRGAASDTVRTGAPVEKSDYMWLLTARIVLKQELRGLAAERSGARNAGWRLPLACRRNADGACHGWLGGALRGGSACRIVYGLPESRLYGASRSGSVLR